MSQARIALLAPHSARHPDTLAPTATATKHRYAAGVKPVADIPLLPSSCAWLDALEELCRLAVETMTLCASTITALVGGRTHFVTAGHDVFDPALCVSAASHTCTDASHHYLTMSVPLRRDDEDLGALHLHSARPRHWHAEDLEIACSLGNIAAAYIATASKLQRQQQLIDQLTYALDARLIVEQAKGITANDRQIKVEKAYELIRRHARCHNATVRAVSEAIVHTGMRVGR